MILLFEWCYQRNVTNNFLRIPIGCIPFPVPSRPHHAPHSPRAVRPRQQKLSAAVSAQQQHKQIWETFWRCSDHWQYMKRHHASDRETDIHSEPWTRKSLPTPTPARTTTTQLRRRRSNVPCDANERHQCNYVGYDETVS